MRFPTFLIPMLIFWPVGFLVEWLLNRYILKGTPWWIGWPVIILVNLTSHFVLFEEIKILKLTEFERIMYIIGLSAPGAETGLIFAKLMWK